MLRQSGLILTCLVMSLVTATVWSQETPPTAPPSVRLTQPIPVTMRMVKGNAVVQGMLLGLEENSISVLTAQGRTIDYANSAVKTMRSADGSIFYTPAKDDANELIQRLSKLQANSLPSGGPAQPGSLPGQPSMAGGQTGAQPGRIPFTMGGSTPAGSHSSSMPSSTTMPSMPKPPNFNPPANQMAHSQPSSMPSGMPMPTSPSMPMGSHMQTPSTPAMPNMGSNMGPGMGPQMGTPPNLGMPPHMGMPTIWEYQCLSCRHRFTSTTEIQPGARCPKCNVLFHSVNGKTNGSSMTSAYRAGSIAGSFVGLGLVVLVIIAVVVRSSS